MNSKKLWSYMASFVLFAATGIMALLVLMLDTSGEGIRHSEFVPIRNCMFAVGIPCLIKFYVSCDKEYKESRNWIIGYFICMAVWVAFIIYTLTNPYFTNIRSTCVASFVLMCLGCYLEYGIIEK